MSEIVIRGGPFDKRHLTFPVDPPPKFGLPTDDPVKGSELKVIPILAMYERAEDGVYNFDGFEFIGEFIGGPAAGTGRIFLKTPELPVTKKILIAQEPGAPASGVAIYELNTRDGISSYHFKEISESAELVEITACEDNEPRLTKAINNFYAHPRDEIYGTPPTGSHVQAYIEEGHRRAFVDECIAPLIKILWQMGFDTLGSCQELPQGDEPFTRAYIDFPRESDASCFAEQLRKGGIEPTYKPKKTKISIQTSDGRVTERLEVVGANVSFPSSDIDRVCEFLKANRVETDDA